MRSAIEESADHITLSVNKILTGYSTTEETQAMIKLLSDEITLKVSEKAGKDEVCSLINLSPQEILLRGNRVIIDSSKFQLNKDGEITATGGTVGGFKLSNTELTGN